MDAKGCKELLALATTRTLAIRAVAMVGERHGVQAMEHVATVFHELWAEEDERLAARATTPALEAPDCVHPPSE